MKKVCIKSLLAQLLFLVGLFSFTGKSGIAGFNADTTFLPISVGQTYSLDIPASPDLNYKISSYKTQITFSVGEIYQLGLNPREAFDIDIQFQMAESVLYDAHYNVNLNNRSPEQVFVYDVLSKPEELGFISVYINDITQNGNISTDVINYINNNLKLKIEYVPDFRIDVRETENGEPLPAYIKRLDNGIFIKNRVQTFKWNDENTKHFPNYEFQLLRLYNLKEKTPLDSMVITTQIDWSKALKVVTTTDEKSITLAIAEGSGYYAWRVRPIGNYYEGGITDSRNYGAWSDAPEDSEEDEYIEVNKSYASLYNCMFFLSDPENNKNWIYSRVFTENNRMSESMVYANGLNQVKQSQSYLSSKDTTLITQSITDFSGRPSMQTIPVPVGGRLGDYKEELVTTSSQLYTAKHFDENNSFRDPELVDSTGYFEYYSNSNTDLFIPTSEGYSFSRTIYENSPLGRVKEQGAPGRINAIGEQTDDRGRTTRVIYSKPSDEELIRIFGDEALPAEAVLKTITIDANNTASVSYTSTSGNVIATCLVYNGEDDESLVDVDGYEDMLYSTVNEVIEQNFKTIDGFFSDRTIVLSVPSTIKIKYNLPRGSASFGCTRISADCEYIVSLSIRKADTDSIWESGDIYLSGITDSVISWIPEREGNFTEGIYYIRKHIRSNANKLNPNIYGSIDESLNPVQNIADVLYSWLDRVGTEQRMLLFYEDLNNFSRLVNSREYDSIRSFSFNLGRINLPNTAYSLETTEGTSYLGITVSPQYNEKLQVYPERIAITGGCCGPVLIPVTLQPATVCYSADEIRQNPELTPDFWTYLKVNLIEPFGDSLNISMTDVEGKTNVLYGYDSISLNQMINFMLTDKYYAGPVIYKNNGDTLKPDSTAIGPGDIKEQYTCSELWNCWKSIINSYVEIASENYTDTLGSVDKGMNDDAKEDGSENPKDDYFDSESGRFGGFFFKIFLKRKLSNRMKDFEKVDEEGENDGDPVPFEFRLMEQFLNCAGFRFAGIVEKKGASTYTGILPQDLNKTYSYAHSDYFYDNRSAKPDSLFLPYIKNPMYAFKYFQYEEDLSITKSPSRKWLNAEVAMCYGDYSSITNPPVCENNCGTRTHTNWNAYERLLFYNSIKDLEPSGFVVDNEEDPVDIDTKLKSMVRVTFNNMRSSCADKCNKKRQSVEEMVIQAFEENCYILNGCPADLNVVLDNDIRFIVDNIINQCISDCDTLFEIAGNMPDSFPKVITPKCQRVNFEGTAWEVVSDEPYAMVLPDDLMHRFEIIENWNLVFALDDAYSQCEYLDRFSSVIFDEYWTIVDNDEWLYSQVYTDSNLIIVTKGANRVKSVYLARGDVAGDFDFSIRVDSMITTSTDATSGIMVLNEENSTTEGFVQAGITGSGNFYYATDTVTIHTSGTISSFPCYLRLARSGGTFGAYYRYDTISAWQSIGEVTIDIPYNPIFGIFVNSAGKGYENLTAFDDFEGGKKYPNRVNNNNEWIGNDEAPYPIYDNYGFPKRYSEDVEQDLTIQP